MKPKQNRIHLRLFMPLAAAALLIPSVPRVQAETVTFQPDSQTYFLQNEQLREGWAIHEGIFSVNGQAAYCIEPKETVAIGEDLYETSSWETYSGYSEELKNTIAELSRFGYGYGSRTDAEYWYATQILIWQAINPAFASTRVYRDPAYAHNLMMSSQASEITDSINRRKQEILQTLEIWHAGLDPAVTDGKGNPLSMPLSVRAGEAVIFRDENLRFWHPADDSDLLVQQDDTLRFFTKQAGTYTFSLQFEGTEDTLESAPLVLKARDGSKIQTLIIRGRLAARSIPLQVNVRDVSLKIHKSDIEKPARAAGGTSLANARYELFNATENKPAGTFVTDETGSSQTIGGLNVADTYTLQETEAPKGFEKDETPVEFTLSEESTDDLFCKELSDRSIKGRIAIHKVITSRNASGPLKDEKNAQFTILPLSFMEKYTSYEEAARHTDELLECEHDVILTDETGRAVTHDLVYGTYMVIQTGAMSPELEYCQPFSVSIDGSASGAQLYELSNLQNEYELRIIKKDARSGKRITLHSAAFQVFDAVGSLVRQKIGSAVYDTFVTASDHPAAAQEKGVWYEREAEKGTVVLPLKLPCGIYTIREVSAPYGYSQNEKEITVRIGAASQTALNDGMIDAVMENTPRSGSLRLCKTIAGTEADVSLTDRKDLSGFVFVLQAEKDILSADDGSLILSAKTAAAQLTTDAEGFAFCENLPYGDYLLSEVRTPAGIRLKEEPVKITVCEETEDIEIHIENSPVLTSFSKKKAAGADELPGARLSVRTEDGSVVDEWISAETPHVIEGLNPQQTYILQEDLTPRDEEGNDAGYVRSEAIRFVPSAQEERTEVIMKDQVVTVEKTDENGQPLAGALLQAVSQDNEVTDTWISDGTPHAVKGLSQGDTCIVSELKAPDGYYRSDDIVIHVSEEAQDQKIVMQDSLIRLRIRKLDESTGKDLAGITLSLYEVNGEEETLIASWLTDGTPIAADGLLKAGTLYRLEETEWTEGFHRAADLFFMTEDIDPLSEEPLTVIMADTPVETGAAKTDGEGNYLAGAHLCLKDEEGTVLHEWISSAYGPEELSKYVAGGRTYILEETEAPEGYGLMEPIRFTAQGTGERHQLIHAVNRPVRIRLEIHKTDAADSMPLEGAVFQVYRQLDEKKALDTGGHNARVTTDENGQASLILPYEKSGYYVLETKAPSGYRLNRSRFEVETELKPGQPVVTSKLEVSDEKKTIETGIASAGGRMLILVSGVLMCVFFMCSKRRFF